MTLRKTHLMAAGLALISITAGMLALRFFPSAPWQVARPPSAAAPPRAAIAAAGAGFLQDLRGHMAPPESTADTTAAEAPAAPLAEAAASAFSFETAPLPPARPRELAMLAPVAVPLPPPRPAELSEAAPEAAPAAAAPAPEAESPATPEPAAPSAATAVARAPEPVLKPAPDDAFSRPDQPPARFNMGDSVYVRIFKQEGQLELWLKRNGRYALYHTYPICKWSGRLGPKVKEADYQSPEGFYSVSAKQLNPRSNYHRAFNVGYPNAFDRQNGRTGGLVMVHGACKSVGCFAMTDKGIDDIYGFVAAAISAGQREVAVHIFPFRMTESAIARETGNGGFLAFLAGGGSYAQWSGFWRNLKEGYDLFEQTGEPPTAFACGDHYAFGEAGDTCKRVAGW